MIEICWRGRDGNARKASALLEDISAAGACLQVESPVPLGAAIEWRSPKQEFRGHVRYCVYQEIGYFIGVEFEPGSKWSKKAFKPRHLLDLQRVMANCKR